MIEGELQGQNSPRSCFYRGEACKACKKWPRGRPKTSHPADASTSDTTYSSSRGLGRIHFLSRLSPRPALHTAGRADSLLSHPLAARPFALRQRRVGGTLASHPPPPPPPHQSTHLPASKRVLKALQRILTTLNGQDVRLGSPYSGRGFPPSVPAGLSQSPGGSLQGPAFILPLAAPYAHPLAARPLALPRSSIHWMRRPSGATP